MTVDGTHRTALLHIPPGLSSGQPAALVIALHGVGGSGPKMAPYSGFSKVADQHRFIVAYPSLAGRYWNSTADRRLPNDVRYLSRLITAIESRECVAWVSRDRCRGQASGTRLATRATEFRWSRCVGGVRVVHIRVLHGRHQWPGATPPDPGPPSTFCSACEIWRFFSGLGTRPRRW